MAKKLSSDGLLNINRLHVLVDSIRPKLSMRAESSAANRYTPRHPIGYRGRTVAFR